MSATFLLICKAIFALAGCAAGVSLARSARNEGGLSVRAWVSALIFIGGVGLIAFAVAPSVTSHSESLARWLFILGDGFERVSLLALGAFVFHVFGRGKAWRWVGLSISWAMILSSWLWALKTQNWPHQLTPPMVEAYGQLAFATPFIWSTVESALEYRRSRRQLRLGLTDALVTHRFLLWSMACGFFSGVTVFSAIVAMVPEGGLAQALLSLSRGVFYLVVATIVTIGLFPPAVYVRYVQGDSEGVAP